MDNWLNSYIILHNPHIWGKESIALRKLLFTLKFSALTLGWLSWVKPTNAHGCADRSVSMSLLYLLTPSVCCKLNSICTREACSKCSDHVLQAHWIFALSRITWVKKDQISQNQCEGKLCRQKPMAVHLSRCLKLSLRWMCARQHNAWFWSWIMKARVIMSLYWSFCPRHCI